MCKPAKKQVEVSRSVVFKRHSRPPRGRQGKGPELAAASSSSSPDGLQQEMLSQKGPSVDLEVAEVLLVQTVHNSEICPLYDAPSVFSARSIH